MFTQLAFDFTVRYMMFNVCTLHTMHCTVCVIREIMLQHCAVRIIASVKENVRTASCVQSIIVATYRCLEKWAIPCVLKLVLELVCYKVLREML